MKAAEVVVAHNKKLSSFERGFIDEEGIKDREWYKNLVVAPGKWTGKSNIQLYRSRLWGLRYSYELIDCWFYSL